MSDNIFSKNLQVLKSRFPALADKVLSIPFSSVAAVATEDGGICYAAKTTDKKWVPLSPHENPIAKSKQALDLMGKRIVSGLSPAVVVGLYPGYVLEIIYRHFENHLLHNEPFRHIYVVIDSIPCFLGWLKTADRSDILSRQEVMFLESGELHKIIELCERDLQRSHLFIPVSELPDSELNKIIQPLAVFYLKRENEEKTFREENDLYYDSISDSELAKIISGKAGRKPRLLMPTHASSSVVQFSTRDICGTFEKMGWETKILKMEQDLSPWLMTKTIHDFKPDLFIFINHTRTEDHHISIYPSNMMFVTWIQDAMPCINRCDAATKWNRAAKSKSLNGIRDLMAGYVSQLKQYGYLTERLVEMSMIVDANVFKPVKLSGEERGKYSCDLCFASNRGKNTDRIIENSLFPLLSRLGFTKSCLYEIHNILWKHYLNGRSIITPKELEDFLILHSESFRKVFTQLEKDECSNTMERIFWILNDPLYRFIVVKWLDEYAENHPGFKMHIYGKDWDTHPFFKKYAKGEIPHGSELNLAYNAAKYCLHLNSNESSHQRLLEITGAGSKVLARDSRYTSRTKSLNSALGKISDRIFINSEQEPEKLSKDEAEELNSCIFATAQQILIKKNGSGNIKNEVIKFLKTTMIKDDKWLLPLSQYKFFNSKDELFRLLDNYEEIPDNNPAPLISKFRNDIHVDIICGAILEALGYKKEEICNTSVCPGFSEVIEFAAASCASDTDKMNEIYEKLESPGFDITYNYITMLLKKRQDEKAKSLLEEIDIEKLLPSQRLDCAILMFQSGFDHAADIIEKTYLLDSNMKDAYAKSGWPVFWPQKQYDKVIEFCQRDDKHGRLSPGWRLCMAQAYAASGDIISAEKHVGTAYSESSDIKDGYSRTAWEYYWGEMDFDSTAKFMSRDMASTQMSPEWMLNYAKVQTILKDEKSACDTVKKAYSLSPDIRDGYSAIGKLLCNAANGIQPLLDHLEKDMGAKRASSASLVEAARYCAQTGDLERAYFLAESAYAADPELSGVYSELAGRDYSRNFDYNRFLKIMEKDPRPSPGKHYFIPEICYFEGDAERADNIIKDSGATGWYSRLAVTLIGHGRLDEALMQYEKLPEEKNGRKYAIELALGKINDISDTIVCDESFLSGYILGSLDIFNSTKINNLGNSISGNIAQFLKKDLLFTETGMYLRPLFWVLTSDYEMIEKDFMKVADNARLSSLYAAYATTFLSLYRIESQESYKYMDKIDIRYLGEAMKLYYILCKTLHNRKQTVEHLTDKLLSANPFFCLDFIQYLPLLAIILESIGKIKISKDIWDYCERHYQSFFIMNAGWFKSIKNNCSNNESSQSLPFLNPVKHKGDL